MPTILNYWEFIAQEATALGSDGCSCVSDWHKECCYEHDLACHYRVDPRLAYRRYCMFPDAYPHDIWWENLPPMSRRQADIAFVKCNCEWSVSCVGKVRSYVRFLGVRIGAFLGIGVRTPKNLA